jgi:hypothetical protein
VFKKPDLLGLFRHPCLSLTAVVRYNPTQMLGHVVGQDAAMARKINRLNARTVATITKHGRHADGGGLYLSISPNGGRRWVFLFRWHGKPTEIGFGSARDVTLARARELASQARAQLAEGINPKDARKPSAGTAFAECADRLIEAMRPSWRKGKHAAQWEMTLRDYAAPLRRLPVDRITTDDVLYGIVNPKLPPAFVAGSSAYSMPPRPRGCELERTQRDGVATWINFCQNASDSRAAITQP